MEQFREVIDKNIDFQELNLEEIPKKNFTNILKKKWVAFSNISNLSKDKYIDLLKKLGKFKQETDPKIINYVYKNILLNLITNKNDNVDSTFQPFSTKSLNIHIENSLNPVEKIPNYLTLYCKQYSQDIVWWNTLVISMKDVLKEFNNKELYILRNSKILLKDNTKLPNTILAYDKNRDLEFLAFRDFWDYNKDWGIDSKKISTQIEKVVSKLYELLYSFDNLYSIPWKKWDLYWLDNKKFLHLRTKQFKSWKRHLQRLRIF